MFQLPGEVITLNSQHHSVSVLYNISALSSLAPSPALPLTSWFSPPHLLLSYINYQLQKAKYLPCSKDRMSWGHPFLRKHKITMSAISHRPCVSRVLAGLPSKLTRTLPMRNYLVFLDWGQIGEVRCILPSEEWLSNRIQCYVCPKLTLYITTCLRVHCRADLQNAEEGALLPAWFATGASVSLLETGSGSVRKY
jgi:hypothetical protein